MTEFFIFSFIFLPKALGPTFTALQEFGLLCLKSTALLVSSSSCSNSLFNLSKASDYRLIGSDRLHNFSMSTQSTPSIMQLGNRQPTVELEGLNLVVHARVCQQYFARLTGLKNLPTETPTSSSSSSGAKRPGLKTGAGIALIYEGMSLSHFYLIGVPVLNASLSIQLRCVSILGDPH